MKNLSVFSTPSVPITTHLNEYEIVDTSMQSIKKPTSNLASFPPRQNASLFTSTNEKPVSISKTNSTNGHYSSSSLVNDQLRMQPKSNGNNNNQQRDTPVSTFSNEGSIRFGSALGPKTTSVKSSM